MKHEMDIEEDGVEEWTALHQAMKRKDLKKAKELVKKGARVDIKDCYYGSTPIQIAAEVGFLEGVKYLHGIGGETYIMDNGFTTLHVAVSNGHFEIAKFLIEAGLSDINHVNKSHMTTLQTAEMGGNVEIIKYLLSLGANPGKSNLITSKHLMKYSVDELLQLAKGFGLIVEYRKKRDIITALSIKIDIKKGDFVEEAGVLGI